MCVAQLLTLALCLVNVCHASYKILDTGSSVSNLWAGYELRLREIVQNAIEVDDSNADRRRVRSVDTNSWTGFVPNLHHRRDQLEIDSIEVFPATLICQGKNTTDLPVLDSMVFKRHYYTIAACERRLSLYGFNSTSQFFLDVKSITSNAVRVTHVKLYDTKTGDLQLFIIVLTTTGLEIFTIKKDKLEYLYTQELAGQHNGLDIIQQNGDNYCMLLMKFSSGLGSLNLFKLALINGKLAFNLITSSTPLEGAGRTRSCTVNGQTFVLQLSQDLEKLNVYKVVENSVESFEVLDAPDAQDFDCFRVGFEDFVVIATSSYLNFYAYDSGFFDIIQKVPRTGLKNVKGFAVASDSNDAVLFVKGFSSRRDFFEAWIYDSLTLQFKPVAFECGYTVNWSGTTPKRFDSKNLGCFNDMAFTDLKSSSSVHLDNTLVAFLPNDRYVWMVHIRARSSPVESPVFRELDDIQRRIKTAASSAAEIEASSRDFEEFSKGILLYGSDAKIEGSWNVGTLQVPSLEIDTLNEESIHFNEHVWIPGLDTIVADLEKKIAELENSIVEVERKLSGVIMNGTEEVVTFDSLEIDGRLLMNQLSAVELSLEALNGEEFDPLVSDLVRRDSNRLLNAIRAVGTVTAGDLQAVYVNGIAVEGVLVNNGADIEIDGDLVFDDDVTVAGDVTVGGTVNGLDLSSQLITAKNPAWSINFTGPVDADDLHVKGLIGSINVNDVLSNVLQKDMVAPSFNEVVFDDVVIEGNLNVASGIINHVNVTALNASVIRLNADETIDSRLEFEGVTLNGSIEVETLNGIELQDFILKSQDINSLVMTGKKTFEGEVAVGAVLADRVNGHQLRDIVTLDGDQTITGPISFTKGFKVANSDLAVATINNLSWQNVREKGLHPTILEQQNLEKDVRFLGNVAIKGALDARVQVGNEDLDSILADLIYQDENAVEITGKKTISSLSTDELRVDGFVNGKKLLEEILTSDTDQTIAGSYAFGTATSSANVEVKGALNGYNVPELLNSVLRLDELDLPVGCALTFENLTVSGKIVVDGAINGVLAEDILFDGVDQTFTAPQTLVTPTFARLIVNGSLVLSDPATLVNQVDLDLFDRKRATLSTDQWINAHWQFDGATMNTTSLLKLNGLTLAEWRANFLHANSSTPQVIAANELDFDRLEIGGNVKTADNKGINDFDWQMYSRDAGDIRGNLTFKTDVTFESLEAHGLQVDLTFNNASLKDLVKDTVFRDRDHNITGIKRFSTLSVKGDVDAQLINGERLIESYLHKNADQHIEAAIRFAGNLAALDVDLVGDIATLNGVPRDLVFSSQTRPFNVHLGDVLIENPTDVKSLYANIVLNEDWNELVSSIVYLDQSNNFTEPINFTKPVEFLSGLQAEFVNNVNIREFSENVVLNDEPATIRGKKTFSSLHARELVTNEISATSVNPDVISTSAKAIYLNSTTSIPGTVHFTKLHVKGQLKIGLLNGYVFPDQYLLVKDDQSLPGNLTVNRLSMVGNISLAPEARINGVDLEEECANTWTIGSNEEVGSTKVFLGDVYFLNDLEVHQKLNGIHNFSEEVVKISEGGSIYGAPDWKNVIVRGDVMGVRLTNDVNLAAIAGQALYADTAIHTNAKWTSKKASVREGRLLLPVEATVNEQSFRVGELLGKNESMLLQSLKVEERNTYRAAVSWHDAMRKAYFKMEYLTLEQTLALTHQVTVIQEMAVNGTSLLLAGTQNGFAMFSRKTGESAYSVFKALSGSGHTRKFVSISSGDFISVSSLETKLWRIASIEPPVLNDISNDIELMPALADQEVHISGLFSPAESPLKTAIILMNEPSKEVAHSTNNTEVKIHKFSLDAKTMVARVPTLSREVVASVVGCPGVEILSVSNVSLKLEHIIQACDVRAISSFSHGNLPDHYLLLAEHDAVIVYHYEGASGFVERLRLPYPSASAVHSWSVGHGYEAETLVAVGKADRVMIHKAVTIGEYIRD